MNRNKIAVARACRKREGGKYGERRRVGVRIEDHCRRRGGGNLHLVRRERPVISRIPSRYYARGTPQASKRETESWRWLRTHEGGGEGGDAGCRLTLDSGVGLPYLYSPLILSYHFALRQVNRPPAYRKPSEHSWDSLSHPSGPTYE